MRGAGGRLLRGQERSPHLYAVSAKSECRCAAATVGNAAGGDHRHPHRVDHLRHKRERADEGFLGPSQERHADAQAASAPVATTASTTAGLEGHGLLDGGRRADHADVVLARGDERRRGWNPVDEADHGRPRVEHGLELGGDVRQERLGALRQRQTASSSKNGANATT